MRYSFAILFIAFCFGRCSNPSSEKSGASSSDSTSFNAIADEYIKGYLDWRPLQAVALGFHEYDGKNTDYSKVSLDAELSRLHNYLNKLSAIDTASLKETEWYDYRILRSAIQTEIFGFEDMKGYTHNPMAYAGAIDVSVYVKRAFAPLEERVKSLIQTEKAIPALFLAAKANLEDTLPKPYIETAVQIAQGNASFLKGDLLLALKDVKDSGLMKDFTTANDSAIAAYNSFIAWLQKDKLPKATNSYAIGRDNYKKNAALCRRPYNGT